MNQRISQKSDAGLNYSPILAGNWKLELTLWFISVLFTGRHHWLYIYLNNKMKDEQFFKLTKVGQPVSYKCIFKFLFYTFGNLALHSCTVTNFAKKQDWKKQVKELVVSIELFCSQIVHFCTMKYITTV